MQGGAEGGPGVDRPRATVAHMVLQVRDVRFGTARRVYGPGRCAVLREGLPEAVRR